MEEQILKSLIHRLDMMERKFDSMDTKLSNIYRSEFSKLDVVVSKVDTLVNAAVAAREESKALEARVLKCETQLLEIRASVMGQVADLEKKFLRWVALAAAISGGTGASILKILSMLS